MMTKYNLIKYLSSVFLFSVAALFPLISQAECPEGKSEVYVMTPSGRTNIICVPDAAIPGIENAAENSSGSVNFPKGGQIAFESQRDGNLEVYIMNADGTNQTNLTNDSSLDKRPVFSPDGSQIVFISYRDGIGEIYIMNADGTDQTRLTNGTGWDSTPVFSPDGNQIAFRSAYGHDSEIYIMNADGTGLINLTNDASTDQLSRWQPDRL